MGRSALLFSACLLGIGVPLLLGRGIEAGKAYSPNLGQAGLLEGEGEGAIPKQREVAARSRK